MIESFKERIVAILKILRFRSSKNFRKTSLNYRDTGYVTKLRIQQHKTPMQALATLLNHSNLAFTTVLNATDKAAVNAILNGNGTAIEGNRVLEVKTGTTEMAAINV